MSGLYANSKSEAVGNSSFDPNSLLAVNATTESTSVVSLTNKLEM